MWSHSLTLSPHGLALSQGPSQSSALIRQFMRLPSLSALSPSYCRDSVWLWNQLPAWPQGPLSPLTMPLPVTYPVPMLCQAHLTFFKMSLASFPEPEHLLVLQNGIQAENPLRKFPAGLLGPQTSRGGSKRLFSYQWERDGPAFLWNPSSLQTRAGGCVFI